MFASTVTQKTSTMSRTMATVWVIGALVGTLLKLTAEIALKSNYRLLLNARAAGLDS